LWPCHLSAVTGRAWLSLPVQTESDAFQQTSDSL
jgi:hypothetical protein